MDNGDGEITETHSESAPTEVLAWNILGILSVLVFSLALMGGIGFFFSTFYCSIFFILGGWSISLYTAYRDGTLLSPESDTGQNSYLNLVDSMIKDGSIDDLIANREKDNFRVAMLALDRYTEEELKPTKIKAFLRDNYQSRHAPPTIKQKEKAWTGCCIKCFSTSVQRELSFWWRIYPKLGVVLLCDECAEKEGLVEVQTDAKKRNRNVTKATRNAVWRRDAGSCVECGSNEDLEFDHIIPHSKGGSNNKRNIQLLCESCNRKKSDNIG